MRAALVFSHSQRSNELVPARATLVAFLSRAVQHLDQHPPEEAAESLHLMVHAALDEEKLTLAEAAEWHDRIDRRYEEVIGQPAPPRPPDPFADEA